MDLHDFNELLKSTDKRINIFTDIYEFTKEIVGPSNVDEIFNKYNNIMNDKANN